MLFSGPYRRDDGLAAHLRSRGFAVDTVDNDPAHGDADDDFLDDAFFDELRRKTLDGQYKMIFAAPPCSTFSISRHFSARKSRRGDGGPPPVRTRSSPQGLSSPPAGHANELRQANEVIERLCELLSAAHDAGVPFVIENPADRGDNSAAHTFLCADHAPLWIHPAMVALQERACAEACTFAQCMLGAPHQKYTTLLYSQELEHWLGGWSSLRCVHPNHTQFAGGALNSSGKWLSQSAAAYPSAMNELLAECLSGAIQQLQQHAPAAEPPAAPATGLKRQLSARPLCVVTRIIPICVTPRALACVPAGGGLFSATTSEVNGAARKAATALAADMIPTLTHGVAAETVFLAGAIGDDLIAVGACSANHGSLGVCSSRAQVLARSLEFGPNAPVWCPLDVIAEGIGTASDPEDNAERDLTYHAAAAAIARALSHAAPSPTAASPPIAIGADVGGSLTRSAADAGPPCRFAAKYDNAISANASLRSELLLEAERCAGSALAGTYTAWADRLVPPPLSEIPDGLKSLAADFSAVEHLATAPFSQRCNIPVTQPLPPPAAQQPCDDGWEPQTLHDVLTPNAVARIQAALARIQQWHAARLAGSNSARPPPLALGISAFQPRARGRIWDLRGCRADGSGRPTLLDTVTPPIHSHLNVEFLEQLFADINDRELVSMLSSGVCVHAELPPQIIIFPNLLSLYDGASGIDAAASAVSELTKFGWWEQHEFIPFAPWRCAPRGAVPRKDGGVARGIVDQGAPRTALFTRPAFEPVTSLNEACRQGRERHEVKPRFGDLARNASILLHIAESIGEPVFTIAFDFGKFFHQLWFRPEELWRMGSLLPLAGGNGTAAELLSIHTEKVMSMGLTPSSEIAQRLANALMQVFAARLHEAERAQDWPQCDAEAQWRARRATLPHDMLGSQARMFDAMCYTDDPCWTVVGVRRTVLAIKVWHDIIDGSGLMPAKAHKWQLGCGALWLGGCCYPSLGIMWVPRDKALRVRQRIQTVLDGTCTPKEYQEIVGFLEHVVDIGRLPRELMAYLHHPMRAGGECELDPHGALAPDGRRDGYLRKWRSILLNTPGASLLAACEAHSAEARAVTTWRLRSDAMLEPNASAMGGCLYGAWWRFPVRRPQLTIPVLELLAACVNFIVFAPELEGAQHVVMEIDALASPTVLRTDRARAPGLRAVLHEFRRLPQLDQFTRGGRLHCAHCWGEANPLADAASRDKRDVLNMLGAALGMQMRQIRMGADAINFISRVLQRLDAQPLTAAEIEFDSTLGYPGEGPSPPASPPPHAALAPGSPSPSLVAFVAASESRHSTANDAAPSPHSPVPQPIFAPAPPSPSFVTSAAVPSPPALAASPEPSPGAESAAPPPPPSLAPSLAAADPWCPSLLPALDAIDAATERHRAFAAAQCSRTAAEALVPSLLTDLAGNPHDAAHSDRSLHAAARAPRATSSRAVKPTSSLSHAAQARARALAAALVSDSDAGGLRLGSEEADHLSARLVQLLEGAAAKNTLRGERSNWKHWMAFCIHRNVAPFRPDVRSMDHTAYDKEVVTLALALLFIYGRMGCRTGRRAPPRPSSALAVLRGIRRAHDRLGVKMADLSLATRLADALNREYIDAHGWEALQVDRVAPLTNPLIAGMLKAEAVAGDSVSATVGRALWATLAQTGFRKAEVSLGGEASFGPDCLTRHNVRWRIGGVEVADPTPKQLRSLREGDLCIIIPPKSKCDQYGLEWGQAPIYLRFHPTATVCAARAIRDLELRLPRHGLLQREGTALFTTEEGQPLSSSYVDRLFKACLKQAGVPSDSAARYSPHSFRRYLACALKASGASDSTIQALLRWKTAESLKLYSFLSDESYANLVDDARTADVSSVRTNALPRAEMLDAAQSFHAARSSLNAAATRAAATEPSDDTADSDCDEQSASGSEDEEQPQRQPTPAPPARGARRTRGAGTSAGDAGDAAPPAPLTLDNAAGRRALAPAQLWPTEPCRERDGSGWEVVISQVDRRLGAVLVGFVAARDERGRRFAREWLTLESLLPM